MSTPIKRVEPTSQNDLWRALDFNATDVLLVLFTAILAVLAGLQYCLNKTIERAYLSVDAANVRLLREPKGKAIARVQISNNGKLPARGVSWAISQKFTPNNRVTKFPIGKPEGEGYLTPGASMVQGGSAFRDEGMARKERDLFLYVWGAVYYHDGFKNRTVYFCHRYNCVNYLPKGRLFKEGEARQHRCGNGTDESPPKSAG
jgi:hypothetical protein